MTSRVYRELFPSVFQQAWCWIRETRPHTAYSYNNARQSWGLDVRDGLRREAVEHDYSRTSDPLVLFRSIVLHISIAVDNIPGERHFMLAESQIESFCRALTHNRCKYSWKKALKITWHPGQGNMPDANISDRFFKDHQRRCNALYENIYRFRPIMVCGDKRLIKLTYGATTNNLKRPWWDGRE